MTTTIIIRIYKHTCGDGNCVVADVSPTATHVDNDLEEASKRNRGAAFDNWISEWDLLRGNPDGLLEYCAEFSMPKISLVLKLFLKPIALAKTSNDLKTKKLLKNI